MQSLRKAVAVFVLLLLTAAHGTAAAEIQSFTAEGYGYLTEDETIAHAKAAAVKDALRNISEQAGVFVRSYTETKDGVLTDDEIESFTASLLKVKHKVFKSTGTAVHTDDGTRVIVAEVTAEIDTDDIDKIFASYGQD